MILIDTSVLIDFLRGTTNTPATDLDTILDSGIPYGINDFIYQEVLQGARTKEEFILLKEYLETLPFYTLLLGTESFEKAAYLNFLCRTAGITIRSTIDLLIAETAIENGLFLLHNDADFSNMARIIPDLKIYST